jgi:tetratricopeptide (TPR) repeat protein
MKRVALHFFFLFFPFVLFAQNGSFTYSNVRGVNLKSDSLPYFIYDKAELDTFLMNNQIIPKEEEIWGVNVRVYISFLVDTLGKPYDLKVPKVDIKINGQTRVVNENHLDTLTKYYSRESSRLIYLTDGMWISNKYNTKKRLNLIIPFETEAYDEKNFAMLKPNKGTIRRPVYEQGSQGEVKTALNIYKYYDFGVQKLNEDKILIAQKYFEQALKVKNDDVDALYNLGICFFKEKKKDKACDAWIKGWQLEDKGAQELLEKYCK